VAHGWNRWNALEIGALARNAIITKIPRQVVGNPDLPFSRANEETKIFFVY
jgi:hypothetical protein